MKILRIFIVVGLIISTPYPAIRGNSYNTYSIFSKKNKENPPLDENQLSEIQEIVDEILVKHKFNGSALIGYENYVLYQSTRGLASLKQRKLLTPETSFQLASVSKSFTALSILILVQERCLQLDDYVKEYIPEFPYPSIKVRHLLNHTSGLPNYVGLAAGKWKDNAPRSNEHVLELLVKYKLRLRFKPGTRFEYSNTGYALLALLVEKVWGSSFHAFLKERIFEPLGMENTFVYNRSEWETRQVAIGHRGKTPLAEVPWPNPLDDVVGDKSIYSTPADLFKYRKAWTTDILLCDSLRKLALTPGKISGNQEIQYGFGWRLKNIEGTPMVYHNGLWHGFTATFTTLPNSALTIILLNNTNAHVGELAWAIARRIEPLLRPSSNLLPSSNPIEEYNDLTDEQP